MSPRRKSSYGESQQGLKKSMVSDAQPDLMVRALILS